MVSMPRIPLQKRYASLTIYRGKQSESRLYTFSPETKEKLRKFRLGTSRAKDPQAMICKIQDSPLYTPHANVESIIS
jgi:hypothetical protein